MKKSSHMIEWLKESKFAIKTPVDHMFWVRPSDVCKRNGVEQTIGDLCFELKQLLDSEHSCNDTNDVQDWYIWDYFPSQEDRRCVFTQMPPLDKGFLHSQPCSTEQLAKIKKLLSQYESVRKHHSSGRILATDAVLSWLQHGTGLQWTTFSYLQSSRSDYSEVLNELCYAGYSDWRIPTIPEIRAMLSADKEIQEQNKHPLASALPIAMPLPVEQTPKIHPSSGDLKGYYVFKKESTVRTGTRYNRSGEQIDDGGNYTGRFIAVRGERKLHRSFQAGWSGTLLDWTEKSMSLVEQGQLPGSSSGWKKLDHLMLYGRHFRKNNYIAAFSAMMFLERLKEIWFYPDEYFHEIPYPLYNLSQIKKLAVLIQYPEVSRIKKHSITHISPDIQRMKNLEDIKLEWQIELTKVPDEMFELPNLTSLKIWNCRKLILSENQVIKICELAKAGVYIEIPPLRLQTERCRMMIMKAVKENGGEIDWNTMNEIDWNTDNSVFENNLEK